MVLAYPAPYRLAAVPGGVVPDQPQGGEALGREASGAPRQQRGGDGTDGAPGDKLEPHGVCLRRPWPHQQAITGQGCGLRLVRRWGPRLQRGRGLGVQPTMLVGLGQPTPPHVVATTQRPRGGGIAGWIRRSRRCFFGERRDRAWCSKAWPASRPHPRGGGPAAWCRR